MSATEVTMIGHASALIEHDTTAVLTDPWYSGAIFNDSWELLTEPCRERLDRVTHIWISHEHPDHLHFPTLKMLQKSLGRPCSILVQKHRSREMVTALKDVGFARVVELPLGKWISIDRKMEVLCLPSRRIDSLLAVRTPSATILNLNDCKMGRSYAQQVRRIVGCPDLLLSQFSIASWPGNRAGSPSAAKRYRVAQRTKGYADVFMPGQLVLFASFVRFCHEENDYMNAWALSPGEAEDFLKGACRCPVTLLYPGDRWRSDRGAIQTGDARGKYVRDWQLSRTRGRRVSVPVAMPDILAAARKLNAKLAERFPAIVRRYCRPVFFYVEDHAQALCFDVARGDASVVGRPRDNCHIALNSQALWYAFAHRWGFDTLDISGRFDLISGLKTPAALRLCDQYSAGLNLRAAALLLAGMLSPGRLWLRRGEVLDTVQRRLLGRPTL